MDNGPWTLYYNAERELKGIISDDSDVVLYVNGDFTKDHYREYCTWLAWILNSESAAVRGPRSGSPQYDEVVQTVHHTMKSLFGQSVSLVLMWLDPRRDPPRMDLATNCHPETIVKALREAADRIERGTLEPDQVQIISGKGGSS